MLASPPSPPVCFYLHILLTSSAGWRTALGPAWMPERRLRVIASAVLHRGVMVSVLVAWVTWLWTRVGARLGAGLDVGAVPSDFCLCHVAFWCLGGGFGCSGDLVVDSCGYVTSGLVCCVGCCIRFSACSTSFST
jgi:hypothetical protein